MSYLSQELKLSFLFGAGAEANGNFDLPSGDDFFKQSLLFESISKKFYSKKDFTEQLKKVFDKEYFKHINPKVYKYRKSCINQANINSYLAFKRQSIDFDKNNITIAGFLDNYFHTIANPMELGFVNFSKIFNYYWAAFFSIINKLIPELVEISKGDLIKQYLEKNKNYMESVFGKDQDFISHFNKFIKDIYNIGIDCESEVIKSTYYGLIKDEIKKFHDKDPNFSVTGIITTNYYNFAEQIIGTKMFDDTIQYAYPNGQLKYFEFPELLEVKDFTKDVDVFYKDKLFFPFIFGQSYLKPEVNQFQLQEMSNLNNILNNTNCLIILGYNLNEDDNHINSYLHNYLLNPENKIVYLHHPQENDNELESKQKSILKSLRFVSDVTVSNQKKSQIIMKNCSNNEDVTKILDELFYK